MRNIVRKCIKFGRKIAAPKKTKKGGWDGLSILPQVDNLIDIGIGHQGTPGLYEYFPSARKIFVDPLIECRAPVKPYLTDDNTNIFVEVALSNAIGEAEIFVRDPISGSGLMRKLLGENEWKEKKRKVAVLTLDSLIEKIGITGSLGIKIDAEGAELKILLGGENCLKKAAFIVMEVPIGAARFEGSYTFEEAIEFMSSRCYSVAAIRASGSGTGHGDIAFVNRALQYH